MSQRITNTCSLSGKTIVQILPALNHGGVERGTIDMCKAIVDADGRAIVISSGGTLEHDLIKIGATHISLNVHSKNPLQWPFIRYQVQSVLKKIGPDIVHIRSRAPAWIVIPVARNLNLKIVTTIHGRFYAQSKIKRLYNHIMLKGDRIIAVSDDAAKNIMQQSCNKDLKLTTIHRGVDLNTFAPEAVTPQRMQAMAAYLNISDEINMPIVMLPSRPSKLKGHALMIEAAALIKHRNFLLLLLGAADSKRKIRKSLTAQIERLGMADRIKLCSTVKDMPAALMCAHTVVMPSTIPEPFGRVAIESAAMKRPVIAFAHGGAMETVVDRKTGWLATPLSISSLATAVEQALSLSAKAYQDMGDNARQHVEQKFSLNQMRNKTLNLYLELINS